ncbi:MAG: iron-containing redox enzyme family protein [Pseudomonadota bacterium]|nr:iron-containing redox enzyme family protein [Pseudomonadota bacterium]
MRGPGAPGTGDRGGQVPVLMQSEWRLSFHELLQGEEDGAILGLASHLARDRLEQAARFAQTEALFESPPALTGPFFGYFDPLRERTEVGSIDAPGFRYLIRQYAPVALTYGSWVAPLAGTATVHRRPFALLFRYHAGGGARRVREGYRRLLAGQGIGLPEIMDEAFIRDGSLLDAAFLPAVLSLCIARSPQGLFPELIGMLLGQALGLLPFRALMAGRCPSAIRGDTSLGPLLGPHDAGLDPISTMVEDHLETAREALGRQGVGHAWHRIRNGLLAQFLAERGLCRSAVEAWEARRRSDRHAAVLAILKAKRPYALGQHRDKTLGDRRIEDWLAPGADLGGLLDALAASDLVDPAAPLQSRFLASLSPGGAMYRVFRDDEIATLVEWIGGLGESKSSIRERPVSVAAEPSGGFHDTRVANKIKMFAGKGTESKDARVLFHRLLNPEQYPEELPAARSLIQRFLRNTATALRGPTRGEDLWFFPYSPGALEARIDAIHHRAVAAYRPFVPPPRLDREEYRWLLTRLAPLVLVDGCWLQKAAWLDGRHAPVAARLLAIYTDEIGGGDPDQNHANIFRRLLEGEGIRLPELTSAAFIAWPGFSAAVFDLPAYLLAISRFPRTFLPEILGLNLAIELSGLGAFYMSVVDEMRYLGLDPAIVTVHLASDNLASGHAALAREAVMIYLDGVGSDFGHEELDRHWRRVSLGYASLRIVPRRAFAVLLMRAVPRFGLARLKKALLGWRGAVRA